jgi:2-dehydropantoate 2-reductase
VTAVVAEPGVIRHTAFDRIIFGEIDGTRSTRLERVLDACTSAGVSPVLSQHIEVDVWSKFVHLSVFSGMTAVTRSSIGPIAADPEVFAMLKAALREAHAVARAKGVPVPDSIIEDVEKAYSTMAPEAKSSMLQDLERGRRLELPWLSGAIVRLGREAGVDTPTHRFIATVLKPHVDGRVTPLG